MTIDDFSMDFFSLNGKTAIFTGGNKGLGLVFAHVFSIPAHLSQNTFYLDMESHRIDKQLNNTVCKHVKPMPGPNAQSIEPAG